jgi:hypothetical protein
MAGRVPTMSALVYEATSIMKSARSIDAAISPNLSDLGRKYK